MPRVSKFPPAVDTTHVPYHDSVWNGESYVQVASGPGSQTQVVYQHSFLSEKTPDFRRLKESQLPMNPFRCLSATLRDSAGSVRRNYEHGPRYYGLGRDKMSTSLLAITSNPWGPDYPNAVSEAQNRALKSMSNMKFNAAQAFAERHQTAGLLIKSVNRFVTFAVLFRKGRFSEANRVLGGSRELFTGRKRPRNTLTPPDRNTFANLWLEYSYGWRPLIGDVFGAAELLAQTATNSRPGKAVGTFNDSKTWTSSYTVEGLTGLARGSSTLKSRCVIYFDISSVALDTLKSTGLSNPALLAWELLPYSFVVDWIYPVGRYLENVNASSGLRFIKGATTTLANGRVISSTTSNGSVWLTDPFTAELNWTEIVRRTLGAFPSASLPSLSLGLNVSQVTSGLALLSQIFKK